MPCWILSREVKPATSSEYGVASICLHFELFLPRTCTCPTQSQRIRTYVPLHSQLEELGVGVESVKATIHERTVLAVSSSIQDQVSPSVCM